MLNSLITVKRIISGGQTGADRGALNAAMKLGIEHGGWCPRGRKAEDGYVPLRYRLIECESGEYPVRTERNVLSADATLIVHRGKLSGGALLTQRLALQHGKPCLTLDLEEAPRPRDVRRWLFDCKIEILNIAGPRESQRPGIEVESESFLLEVLRVDDSSEAKRAS